MPNGLSNQPKLSKGALVDIDPQIVPPLIVQFQFNPETIQRRRSITLRDPTPRQGHESMSPDDEALGEAQATLSDPEIISLDIRLDATDRLEQGDPATIQFGVLPELSALELMATPRPPSPFSAQLGLSDSFGFSGQEATPVLVFVWGRYRAYAVRLTELSISETEHSPALNPTRVIASVTLQVLEGANVYTRFAASQRALALRSAVGGRNLIRSLINLG
jgi:hypothetical protein